MTKTGTRNQATQAMTDAWMRYQSGEICYAEYRVYAQAAETAEQAMYADDAKKSPEMNRKARQLMRQANEKIRASAKLSAKAQSVSPTDQSLFAAAKQLEKEAFDLQEVAARS